MPFRADQSKSIASFQNEPGADREFLSPTGNFLYEDTTSGHFTFQRLSNFRQGSVTQIAPRQRLGRLANWYVENIGVVDFTRA
jgi:hypothetical protein